MNSNYKTYYPNIKCKGEIVYVTNDIASTDFHYLDLSHNCTTSLILHNWKYDSLYIIRTKSNYIGYIALDHHAKKLDWVHVFLPYQNNGIATRIISMLVPKNFSVDVHASSNQTFWERLGFVKDRKYLYRMNREDIVDYALITKIYIK